MTIEYTICSYLWPLCIQKDVYVLRNRTFQPKYIVCLCKQGSWYILWRQFTYDSEKEVAEQEQWKASLFPKGYIYTAKGSGARDTWLRKYEYFSGKMELKATNQVRQPIFLSPGITASHPRKNAVALVTF